MLPPNILKILFQFRSQRSVVKKSGISVVNFGRWKDDSSSFAQRNNFFHIWKVWFLGFLLFCRSRGSLFGRGRRQDASGSGRNGGQGTTAAERKGLCDILSAEKHHYGGCWKLHWGLLFFRTAILKWISTDKVFDTIIELGILENIVQSLFQCVVIDLGATERLTALGLSQSSDTCNTDDVLSRPITSTKQNKTSPTLALFWPDGGWVTDVSCKRFYESHTSQEILGEFCIFYIFIDMFFGPRNS